MAVDRRFGADDEAVGGRLFLAEEIESHRRRRQVEAHRIAQRRLRKDRLADAERQLARVGPGIGEMHVVAGKRSAQPRQVGRLLGLRAPRLRLLHLLQQDDVGVMAEDLGNGHVEIDRRAIGISVVPRLAELHVELQDSELAHGSVPQAPED